MSKKTEIYKNIPLIETVFEIRFPAEPAIECNRDKLYEKIRNIYSKILIPTAVPGKATAFEPYRFESVDGDNGIMLSIDKLAFYCKKYEGFNSFKEETMRLFSIFEELFKIQKLRRAGLRYINFIPFVRENDIIPIENYLNIKIVLPNSITTDFKNLSLIFVSPTKEGGSLTTRIESAISNDKKQEGIILDFDYAQEGDLYFLQIDKYLEESHANTKYLFEQLITENYKKVMRGKENKQYIISNPIAVKIYQDEALFFAENENLNVCGTGETSQEAIADLHLHILHFYEYYRKINKEQLVGDAVRLKKLYHNLLIEGK